MNTGWIKVYRQIEDGDLWLKEPFTRGQAWLDLIIFANHKDGSFWIQGVEIKVKRGQIAWSEVTMAKRWKWSRGKVRRFLKWLKNDGKTVQQSIQQKTTIITLVNYNKWQQDGQGLVQPTVQLTDSRRYINKNDKNDKNNISIDKKPKNKRTLKKEKTYTKENLTIQEVANKLIKHFENENGRKSKLAPNSYKNLAYWLEVYEPNEIAEAISQIKYDSFWKDKMDLTILFRQSSKGEPVNWIDQLLNKKKENYAKRI